jgi:hypothetical protein
MVVAAVEEMQQRAGNQEGVRDQAEQMLPVLRVGKVDADKRQPKAAAKTQARLFLRFIVRSS